MISVQLNGWANAKIRSFCIGRSSRVWNFAQSCTWT
jgi:hypothetical protein